MTSALLALLAIAQLDADPSNYRSLAAALQPGETLRLAPGDYADCLEIDGLHGEPDRPIVITGPESGPPAVFLPENCFGSSPPFSSVTIMIRDSSHLVIRRLEIDGRGLPVDGIEAGYGAPAVHHLTLEHLYIHDNDDSTQVNCISSFSPAWDWIIRFNRLERCGLGIYLGSSTGADPFIRGTIEHNLIADPLGYGMQIKQQNPRPTLPGIPGDGSATAIRHNVFIKAENAAVGDDARPNLLVGHYPLFGDGMNDRYEIYGNLFFENASDIEPLFQGEGNVAFHDNLLINTFAGYGVWIRPHNDVPREVAVYRNTFLTANTALAISGGDAAFRQTAIGNAIYSGGAPAIDAADAMENVVGTLLEADLVFANTDPRLGAIDLYPISDVLRGPPLDLSAYDAHAEIELDFNGTPRDGTWRGAYEGSGTNPGWLPAREIKPSREGSDASVSADAGELGEDGSVSDSDAGARERPDAGDPPDPDPPDERGGCTCASVR